MPSQPDQKITVLLLLFKTESAAPHCFSLVTKGSIRQVQQIYEELTLSKGKKNADALDDLLPAFNATALPFQSITGEPLDPPLVPDAACEAKYSEHKSN